MTVKECASYASKFRWNREKNYDSELIVRDEDNNYDGQLIVCDEDFGIVFFNFLEHFFWTLFCFHSCKVDPHWCGAQTSNPWESRHSAVRFRLPYVRQTNISTRV